jgi:hypothetical protein
MAVYGTNALLSQVLGSLVTKGDRASIAFPNILQHQVQLQPFELVDTTTIGVRKILVLFLVDPTIRIISTAFVPPQQSEWYQSKQTDLHKIIADSTNLIDDVIGIVSSFNDLGSTTIKLRSLNG